MSLLELATSICLPIVLPLLFSSNVTMLFDGSGSNIAPFIVIDLFNGLNTAVDSAKGTGSKESMDKVSLLGL